jgi:homoserine kinase type II
MDKEKIKSLLFNWNVGDLISYKRAKKGVVNFNYIVKTTRKFILRKVGSMKNLKQIKFELKYLDYFKNAKFSYQIPYPIKTKSNKLYVLKENTIFWLYKYIEGKNVARFGKAELKEIAKMMAEYHYIIEKSNLDNKTNYSPFARKEILEELGQIREKIMKKSSKDRKEKIFLDESEKLIPLFKKINSTEYSKLPRYSLHRDINPENTLWKNGKLTGIIDFENVSEIKDTLVKDIAVMLQYSCRDKNERYKIDLELANFFIREYKKYHKLSNKEIIFIPDIITAGAIEDFCYSYWLVLNDPKRTKPHWLKSFSKSAQWHNQNKAKIVKRLM